jgi:hypothetical protein
MNEKEPHFSPVFYIHSQTRILSSSYLLVPQPTQLRGITRQTLHSPLRRSFSHRGTMHQKYTAEVGKPDHVGIVVDWDGTKKKIRHGGIGQV